MKLLVQGHLAGVRKSYIRKKKCSFLLSRNSLRSEARVDSFVNLSQCLEWNRGLITDSLRSSSTLLIFIKNVPGIVLNAL